MSLFNWKHKELGQVVDHVNYAKIPRTFQPDWEVTDQEVTHRVEDTERLDGAEAGSFCLTPVELINKNKNAGEDENFGL